MKITVAGLGPGHKEYILPVVTNALQKADVIIGYDYYFQFCEDFIREDAVKIAMPLGKEEERAVVAVEEAKKNQHVFVIGSGDASIYSMAAIVYQVASLQPELDIELETLPGVSAFLAAGSKLGAPLGHDFCCISLSDLMTPWQVIEKRIRAAASGDFVTSLYNPKSKKRYWQLERLKKIFLEERDVDTPVAIIRQVTRPEEKITIQTLGTFDVELVDMFSLVMIGNSQTYQYKEHLITPRGYLNRKPKTGLEIQQESFRIVTSKLQELMHSIADKWAITRVIHTTGVLDDHVHYEAAQKAVDKISRYLQNGGTIVTDVTMVQAGITKQFSKKYKNQIVCCLNDEDTLLLAEKKELTRSQAGIRKAISLYPNALYVVGNAPTALFEITDQLRDNPSFKPAGVIGVPVGFVNVLESKEQLVQSKNTPWITLHGNRGGSNIAAALVNACFTLQESSNYF
ncbi:precorrin-3B C(17)-methyltransferase [Flammeovirga kamogawensis]|uniref:Precorrin-3B C(17)-methyltransferase n=1 Tax=Flammeovirga kamogawensis TaxID=373891 RepID=A0ABX8H3B1_9BACT|nr:precorrin-3B C(17)-methyltransferase [Flammeovirga kamogawensis]MBB6460339.1 precorrin-3B C17-methyltransferase [Flammeovirga kamogawensis]QWG10148.1 precorrin-3B C(17)-methyltransferase [Flammeovirga kamogawensis]TRX65656.1 precorrin-3B C(17)-methyltransferase [Flammeovirga kamogawensis]